MTEENQPVTKTPVEEKRFYDQGWNAYVNGEPFPLLPRSATIDWIDGWRDAAYYKQLHGKHPEKMI